MNDDIRKHALRLLDGNRIMSLATNRPDGWPQVTVVGYVNDGFTLYTFVGRDGQKYANILRDPRVSIAIAQDTTDPLKIEGLSMAAHAVCIDDKAEFAWAVQLLAARYPEYLAFPLPSLDQAGLLQITPQVMSVLDYTQGFGHADLVEITPDDIAAARAGAREHAA